jgi:hypothetical protein
MLDPVLGQINPIHNSYLISLGSILILSSYVLMSSKWVSSFQVFLTLVVQATCPVHFTVFDFLN